MVDGRVSVCHTVTGGRLLAVGHATDELLVGGLIVATVSDTCLSGVVQEGRVLNPQCHIPGLVVCPPIVGAIAGVVGDEGLDGHGSFRFDGISLQGHGGGLVPPLCH